MKFAQFVSSYTTGDAVSNSARNLGEVLSALGFETRIFADHVHPGAAKDVYLTAKFNPHQWDAVLYHFAFASPIAEEMTMWPDLKRYILYHNVTPSHYFRGYDEHSREACKNAREQLYLLKDHIDCAFAVSNYNAAELKAIGYKQVELMPIWFDSKLNEAQTDERLQHRFDDGFVNFLFVGRLTPHKSQHDLLKVFYLYKTYYNPNSRLLLVGSGQEKYVSELRSMILQLKLKDVHITGHVTDSQLATYYRCANVFLSMSEHEGFCVPLLESMNFGLPIVAYDAAAIGETLGTSGVKLKTKDPRLAAELLHEILTDPVLKTALIQKQYERLQQFQLEPIKQKIIDSLGKAGLPA
ncbi:MAG: hypothetical protein JWN30_671 [Bacilli bacterium]|nr:hypothetical protein [Bacilli bacterium]